MTCFVDFDHALIPIDMERMSATSEKDRVIFKTLRSLHHLSFLNPQFNNKRIIVVYRLRKLDFQ